MAWLKEERPDLAEKAYKVLQPKDYLLFKLCGEFVTDYWSARPFTNLQTGKINQEILDFCGYTEEIVPRLYAPDEICGELTSEEVCSLGLKKGVKLICGCSDGFAGLVSSGVFSEENLAFNSTGTSEIVAAANYKTAPFDGVYIFPEQVTGSVPVYLGPSQSGGGTLLWLCNNVLHLSFEEMVSLAEQAEVGCDGLVFLPYLSGERAPVWDSNAKGCFFRLKNTHTSCEMSRSVMEGVAFAVRSIIEGTGQTPDRLRLLGGGSKIELWNQIRADVLGIPVDVIDCEEACAQGGAMLAGKGIGVYSSLSEASRIVCKVKKTYSPNPNAKAIYDNNYAVYKALYQATKHLNG
jgi:xylulokinase